MTIREHDLVVLTADIPEESLEQGDVGTVVPGLATESATVELLWRKQELISVKPD